MIKYLLKKVIGSHSDHKLKEYRAYLNKINNIDFSNLSQEQAIQKAVELKNKVQAGALLTEVLPEAFALVRNAAEKSINERHFDVQILGGLALHFGNIAEMKTGEGKTLTSTLAVFLNSLTGKGVHVVTVNDYLAKRDSIWMGKIYNYLGLSVGLIVHGLNDEERKAAYAADVTYGTNNEFGFDYLRDNMKFNKDSIVQRELNFAIVDEVDSILIDEARTPLIISGPSDDSTADYELVEKNIYGLVRAKRKADNPQLAEVAAFFSIPESKVNEKLSLLKEDSVVSSGHYTLDEKSKAIQLTDQGAEAMEQRLASQLKGASLFDLQSINLLHHVNQALKATYVFKKDVDYIVEDGLVKIVDEFTGRIMEGRRFSEGLHQALEAKEHVNVQRENQTLATITFQNYFRKYKKLSGMTGTALTEEDEFMKIYHLGVVVIPTNLPMVREDKGDLIYKNKAAKDKAIVDTIKNIYTTGQPLLVGTDSIENSEHFSRLLHKEKIPHEVLNAKNHIKEAEIIAMGGNKSRVTIATNMAGRGTDIKLGAGAKEVGGLFVLGTARHESRRIDNQLRGRSGRQGDPGTSRFILSLEDDLMRIFGGQRIISLMNRLKMPDDEPIEHSLISRAIESAQQKVEAQNFSLRKHLLEYDDVMNRQREVIYNYRRELLNEESSEIFESLVLEATDELISQKPEFDGKNKNEVDAWMAQFKAIFNFEAPDFSGKVKEEMSSFADGYIKKQLDDKRKSFGEVAKQLENHITLNTIDNHWKEHLMNLDYLRQSIGLRGFAQKNPLDEYKKEAYGMFKNTMRNIAMSVTQLYFRIKLENVSTLPAPKEIADDSYEMRREDPSVVNRNNQEASAPVKPKAIPVRSAHKVGRNDKCPCGSGKKFKNCDCDLATAARNNVYNKLETN